MSTYVKQGRSQHGALFPKFRYCLPPPDGFGPDHGLHLAMRQLLLKITIMPVSITSHIMKNG